jgi:hypothetical protein
VLHNRSKSSNQPGQHYSFRIGKSREHRQNIDRKVITSFELGVRGCSSARMQVRCDACPGVYGPKKDDYELGSFPTPGGLP